MVATLMPGLVQAALTTTDLNARTPADLVNALLGSGVTASSISFTGVPRAGGTFGGGSGW